MIIGLIQIVTERCMVIEEDIAYYIFKTNMKEQGEGR